MARKMKDSGIEWIGEIPEDWITIKLLFALDRPITDGPHETPSYTEEGVPFLTINNIDDDGNIDKEKANKISKIDAINYNKKAKMKIGDLLFSKSATIGRVSEVDKLDFMVWSPFAIISTKENLLHNKYLKFILSLPGFIDYLIGLGSVNTQINIGMRDMEKSIIPLPNLKKQILISSYLDKKTEQIKKLKDTVNKEIETLENYKKSVITEAVTKGLDKNVEMKDSGIEWIGEIPKHWGVSYLKNFFYEGKNKNRFGRETNLLSLSYGKIINKDINTQTGLLPKNFNNYNIVEKDSIIIRPTDLQNDKKSLRTGLVKENGIITSAYINLKPKKNVVSKYFHYLLHCYDLMKVFYNMGSGVRQGLTYSEFSKLLVLSPTKLEQQQIVDYLNNKTKLIDDAIATKQKQLETLEEYKKSLIYEYVTGKKEVELG